METALTTTRQKLLQQYQMEIRPTRLPPMPQIKMVNAGSSVKMQKGEYYTVTFEKEEGNSEPTKVEKSIGMNPEVVILRRRYTYSFFDEAANDGRGKLVAWTNELDGFFPECGPVYLVMNTGKSPTVRSFDDYYSFKSWKQQDEQLGQQLDFKNVLYVLFEGQVYRMFVSNASVTGVKDFEKTGDYKDPQPGSFLTFEKTLQAAEPQAYFQRKVRLGSRFKQGGMEFYLMTFEDAGRVEDDTMLEQRVNLDRDLGLRFDAEFRPLIQAEPQVADVIDVAPHQPFAVSDLPF